MIGQRKDAKVQDNMIDKETLIRKLKARKRAKLKRIQESRQTESTTFLDYEIAELDAVIKVVEGMRDRHAG